MRRALLLGSMTWIALSLLACGGSDSGAADAGAAGGNAGGGTGAAGAAGKGASAGAAGKGAGAGNSGNGAGAAGTGASAGSAGNGSAGARAGKGGSGAGASGGTGASGAAGASGGPAATCAPPIDLVDTSKPATVVGSGSAATCTEAALAEAIQKAGIITFDCGGPATIAVTKQLALRTDVDTTLDGHGKITLDGGGATRIFDFAGPDFQKTKTVVTLQRMTFAHAKATGTKMFPPAPAPCSQGYQDGGGGVIQIRDGVLHVIDSAFVDNAGASPGPDVAGGAIYAIGAFETTIVGSTFSGNSAANGGAIGSLWGNLRVFDSVFSKNAATGTGANYISSMCPLVGGQNEAGDGGNGGAIVIDGGEKFDVVMCGNTFRGNVAGALGGAIFRTPDLGVEDSHIDRSTFDGNSADGGGAMYFHHSNLTITASTISNNSANGAGAIQSDDTFLVLTNVTVAGNFAKKSPGGAISLFGNGGTVTSCTFANNHCDGAPGQSFAAHLFGGTKLTVTNTIFTGAMQAEANAPMSCQGENDGASDLQWPKTHSSGQSPDAPCVTGITFADPLLGALGDNGGPTKTMIPAAGSPALGLGKACPATDQRGTPRKADGCTAGALEVP